MLKKLKIQRKIGIFGSQKASHFANIMLHLTYDKDENKRGIVLAKNKQNGKYSKQEIFFDTKLLVFNTFQTTYSSEKKVVEEPSKKETKARSVLDLL